MTEMTSLELATQAEQRKQESIDRSDTDGFVSQWAHGVTADKYRLQAEIDAAGGTWFFDVLVDAVTGEKVKAKEISTQYGYCYAVQDEAGRFTGEFVPTRFTARSKWWAKYRIGSEEAPAKAVLWSPPGARGLGGATSVQVIVVRI